MKKIAVIGASCWQEPLIKKAKAMGIETHVFAWAANDVGEEVADYFYPISITEKEAILKKCEEIGIDGICSIGSDLAMITVNYVASRLGLVGNTEKCVKASTNKHLMRKRFEECGDPSPKSILVESVIDLNDVNLNYPIIIKPIDRSGSRGITKLEHEHSVKLKDAIEYAKGQGFEKYALVEEFVPGQEYSVECISWHGRHYLLSMTQKFTTGSPHFIETAHLEPVVIDKNTLEKVKHIVFHALSSLQIENGASHSEIKIMEQEKIEIIEIGGRMGGDGIGSHLVEWSTGIDYVRAVIQIALGEKPDLDTHLPLSAAAVRFIMSEEDLEILKKIKSEHPEYLIKEVFWRRMQGQVTDSSTRFGFYLLKAPGIYDLKPYLPTLGKEHEEKSVSIDLL